MKHIYPGAEIWNHKTERIAEVLQEGEQPQRMQQQRKNKQEYEVMTYGTVSSSCLAGGWLAG